MAGGVCAVGGMHGTEACVAGQTTTAADGTHPTGMHCYVFIFLQQEWSISYFGLIN